MNRSPAFQLYPDKAIAGTVHLGPAAFAAYWRIVFWMWLNSDDYCSISNEKNAICAAAQLSLRRYNKVWVQEIMPEWHPMFRVEGNRLVCNGLRKEYAKQSERREKARQAGLVAAKNRLRRAEEAAKNLLGGNTVVVTPTVVPSEDVNDLSSEGENTPPPKPSPAQKFMDTWNDVASKSGIPRITTMGGKREATLKARLRDPFWRDNWKAALDKIKDCPFLMGDNDREWRANIKFFLKPDTVAEIIEGQHDKGGRPLRPDLGDGRHE